MSTRTRAEGRTPIEAARELAARIAEAGARGWPGAQAFTASVTADSVAAEGVAAGAAHPEAGAAGAVVSAEAE